nr:MAG TPA: hypothetical protein [Caudoviricetes sp.]
MKRCYYCHKKLTGRIHYVVTPSGNLAPVCADDRECKPRGITCHGDKPKAKKQPRTRALKRNQGANGNG